MDILGGVERAFRTVFAFTREIAIPVGIYLFLKIALLVFLHLIAPQPRGSLPSEKIYRTSSPSGTPTTHQLPCWYDRWLAERRHAPGPSSPWGLDGDAATAETHSPESLARIAALGIADFLQNSTIEPAGVAISVVFPAYNEELRIEPALEEAVEYLDEQFGRPGSDGNAGPRPGVAALRSRAGVGASAPAGYEIIVVDDGSTDKTEEVTLNFAHRHGLHDVLRFVKLEKNRGKGGSITHGFRHVRGEYVLFADADGASRFSDLGKLIEGCETIVDGSRRGVAIGSRAHLVGSDAVVTRSRLRNFLMRGFHFVLSILTPPATSRIRDTQCGFKLFTRPAIPHIIPYMHAEGWIFDIEMLMLAESAPATAIVGADGRVIGAASGIRVVEIPVGWSEIPGSKLNVVDASIRMALGLAVLRASWMMGVYRRRFA